MTSVLDTQQAYWRTLQYRVKMPSRRDTKRWLGDTRTEEAVPLVQKSAEPSSTLTTAVNDLRVSEQGKESLVMMTHLRDDDMSMTLLASGDSSENACEGGSESEAVGACAGGDIEGQDNNSNNLVTGAEGDGIVEDQREMFAVMPLTWCPHLVEVQPLPEHGIDANQRCDECQHIGENWVCLTCYTVSCSKHGRHKTSVISCQS
ncbi:Histone deacetylase 6 [Lamellibrachia satsuma]|nr:Histone deacetylase 6 [Lamellibrachia satsuma]